MPAILHFNLLGNIIPRYIHYSKAIGFFDNFFLHSVIVLKIIRFFRSLNVSIQLDEDKQPDETPKKTRPMNRFSSPLFSDKLMSDLGSVLNKKKSPVGKV